MAPEQPVSKRAKEPANASASIMPADVMNRESLLELFDQDETLLSELAELFLDDSTRLMQDIRAGVAAFDAEKVERAAHTLKGSVGNFGAKRGFELARRMEAMGRGHDLVGAPQALIALEEEMSCISASLAEVVRREPK